MWPTKTLSTVYSFGFLAVGSIALSGYVMAKPDAVPVGRNVGPLRFDACLELNAPLVGTHVVLFLRYWVSATSYRVAVIWAEPHAGSLNFPDRIRVFR